jgi:hypothetical protein
MPDIKSGSSGPANARTEGCCYTHFCYAILFCGSAVSRLIGMLCHFNALPVLSILKPQFSGTQVPLKNAVFWDVGPCGFIINRRLGETCRFRLQGRRNNATEEKC